ncbi:MAG: serine acetyltransferase [Anaerolineales bacterium]|nr:serine acetyltransferase [Anaerolineales bacterium]
MTLPLFHLILFRRSAARETIEKDIPRWIRFINPALSSLTTAQSLVWLLNTESLKEFRNLFYYRIGRPDNIFDRILLKAAQSSREPRRTLSIRVPFIGHGFVIKHGVNTIVHAERIGVNCLVFQGVTIGYKMPGGGLPTLGDHVHVSVGAKVLGPITVGDEAIIGANSVVVNDLPPHSMAMGVPVRTISRAGTNA